MLFIILRNQPVKSFAISELLTRRIVDFPTFSGVNQRHQIKLGWKIPTKIKHLERIIFVRRVDMKSVNPFIQIKATKVKDF